LGPIRARRTTKAGTTTGHDTLARMTDLLSVPDAVELLEGLQSGRGDAGAAVGEPVVVVDLDAGLPTGAEAAARLEPPPGWPGVVIAVSQAHAVPPAPRGPDVLVSAAPDPPRPWVSGGLETARAVEAAVRRNPVAATTLAQVLRAGPTLGVGGALTVESLAYSTLQAGPEHRQWLETRRARAVDGRQDPAVRLDRRGDTLWLTLDRPERRNAYSARMRDELVAGLEVPAFDPSITAVHVAGAGPNFCSGGDLAEFGALPDPATAHTIRTQRSAGWRISQLADRLTVHLHGACVGAGIELAAFAGRVEATADATMALPEVGMGLIPGAGGTASLPRRIGPARTAWLALTGVRLDAHTAHRWGLVDHLVPDGFDGSRPGEAK
jgi:enoyl-CoA hydratase/carnithine racemase